MLTKNLPCHSQKENKQTKHNYNKTEKQKADSRQVVVAATLDGAPNYIYDGESYEGKTKSTHPPLHRNSASM